MSSATSTSGMHAPIEAKDWAPPVVAPASPEAETSRLLSGADMEAFLRHLPGIAFIKDTTGRYVWFNAAFERAFAAHGASLEAWRGRTRGEVWPPELAERFTREDRALLQDGGSQVVTVEIPHEDGSHSWMVHRFLIEHAGARCIGGMGVDLTEQRRVERERGALQHGLAVADRLATVGTLAAGVAHEINNPLACIMANLTFLSQRIGSQHTGAGAEVSEDMEQCTRDALEAAERVKRIVRDLMSYSTASSERVGEVDVQLALEGALALASHEIRHRARLVREYGDVPPVHANDGQLGQVFLHLLLNAAHAIPEGDTERNEIRVTTRRVGDQVAIEVRDSGLGIPVEIASRLFDPFFTTKGPQRGTGLGLFICHGIVRSLGGDITVTSEPGQGAMFRVTLPRARFTKGTDKPVPGRLRPARARILVVDDEPLVGTALRRLLSDHEIEVVESGKIALERFEERVDYDLVLLDVMMPDLGGIETYHQAVARRPELAGRIVFMTGGAFTPGAREFLDSNQARCIEKPFSQEELRALLDTAAESHQLHAL